MPIDRPDNRSFGYRLARLAPRGSLSFSLILSLDSVHRVEVSFRNYFDFDDENFFRLKRRDLCLDFKNGGKI